MFEKWVQKNDNKNEQQSKEIAIYSVFSVFRDLTYLGFGSKTSAGNSYFNR
jgi:hypothetical protein